jgi:hypothetical protein
MPKQQLLSDTLIATDLFPLIPQSLLLQGEKGSRSKNQLFKPLSRSRRGVGVRVNRENINAFQVYVDRSKASGRMITINPGALSCEDTLEQKIQQATSGEAESN